jgi:hypothetical protein
VSGPEVELAGGTFGVGDRVVVKRNELRLGVSNGSAVASLTLTQQRWR